MITKRATVCTEPEDPCFGLARMPNPGIQIVEHVLTVEGYACPVSKEPSSFTIRLRYRPRAHVLEVVSLRAWVQWVYDGGPEDAPDGAESLVLFLASHAAEWVGATVSYDASFSLRSGVLNLSGVQCGST